jgi:hypothetical protein
MTEQEYRERIRAVQMLHKLTVRSAIAFIARNPPRPSTVSLWRAWERFGGEVRVSE